MKDIQSIKNKAGETYYRGTDEDDTVYYSFTLNFEDVWTQDVEDEEEERATEWNAFN